MMKLRKFYADFKADACRNNHIPVVRIYEDLKVKLLLELSPADRELCLAKLPKDKSALAMGHRARKNASKWVPQNVVEAESSLQAIEAAHLGGNDVMVGDDVEIGNGIGTGSNDAATANAAIDFNNRKGCDENAGVEDYDDHDNYEASLDHSATMPQNGNVDVKNLSDFEELTPLSVPEPLPPFVDDPRPSRNIEASTSATSRTSRTVTSALLAPLPLPATPCYDSPSSSKTFSVRCCPHCGYGAKKYVDGCSQTTTPAATRSDGGGQSSTYSRSYFRDKMDLDRNEDHFRPMNEVDQKPSLG